MSAKIPKKCIYKIVYKAGDILKGGGWTVVGEHSPLSEGSGLDPSSGPVLRDDADQLPQRVLRHVRDVLPVNQDLGVGR